MVKSRESLDVAPKVIELVIKPDREILGADVLLKDRPIAPLAHRFKRHAVPVLGDQKAETLDTSQEEWRFGARTQCTLILGKLKWCTHEAYYLENLGVIVVIHIREDVVAPLDGGEPGLVDVM